MTNSPLPFPLDDDDSDRERAVPNDRDRDGAGELGEVVRLPRKFEDSIERAVDITLSRCICASSVRSVGDIYEVLSVLLAYGATDLPNRPPLWRSAPSRGRGPQSALGSLGLARA